jgi:hypothetical protein
VPLNKATIKEPAFSLSLRWLLSSLPMQTPNLLILDGHAHLVLAGKDVKDNDLYQYLFIISDLTM